MNEMMIDFVVEMSIVHLEVDVLSDYEYYDDESPSFDDENGNLDQHRLMGNDHLIVQNHTHHILQLHHHRNHHHTDLRIVHHIHQHHDHIDHDSRVHCDISQHLHHLENDFDHFLLQYVDGWIDQNVVEFVDFDDVDGGFDPGCCDRFGNPFHRMGSRPDSDSGLVDVVCGRMDGYGLQIDELVGIEIEDWIDDDGGEVVEVEDEIVDGIVVGD